MSLHPSWSERAKEEAKSENVCNFRRFVDSFGTIVQALSNLCRPISVQMPLVYTRRALKMAISRASPDFFSSGKCLGSSSNSSQIGNY